MAKILAVGLGSLTVQANAMSMDNVIPKEQRKRFRNTLVNKLDKMLDIEDETHAQVQPSADEPNGLEDCLICQSSVGLLGPMINTPEMRSKLEDVAAGICADYVETTNSTVCAPATHMMGEIVVPSLMHFIMSPDYVCSERVLAQCEYPKFVELHAQDYLQAQMNLKKEALKSNDFIDNLHKEIKSDKKKREILKVVHMSDIHLDFNYTPGTIANCNLPICCRPENGFTTDPLIAAGNFGDYNCDLQPHTYQSMLQFIKDDIKPDMFVWTGDNSVHDVWKNTSKQVKTYTEWLTTEWLKVFGDEPVSMLPVLGNHDTWPVNNMNLDGPGLDPIVVQLDKIWGPFLLTESSKNTFKNFGYYSQPLVLKNGRKIEKANVIGINC